MVVSGGMRLMANLYLLGLMWMLCLVQGQSVPVYLSQGENNITANNTEILITDIGQNDTTSLTCHTDLTTCCRGKDGGAAGEWYYPTGTMVPNNASGVNFARLKNAPQLIRLYRRIPPAALSPTGLYCCVIPTTVGEQTFCANLVLFSITTHPMDQTNIIGQDVLFSVATVGEDSWTYQWQKDLVNLNNTADTYTGTTATTLIVLSVAVADEGNYNCVITGSERTITSNSARLTVAATAPTTTAMTVPTTTAATVPTTTVATVPTTTAATVPTTTAATAPTTTAATVSTTTAMTVPTTTAATVPTTTAATMPTTTAATVPTTTAATAPTTTAATVPTTTAATVPTTTVATVSTSTAEDVSTSTTEDMSILTTKSIPSVPVYFSLGETNITTNNTKILINDIGMDDTTSLTCHTDLTTCCRSSDGGAEGEWYYPDGTVVPNNASGVNFARIKNAPQLIRLYRRIPPAALSPTGLYCCVIPTTVGEQTFCANLAGTVSTSTTEDISTQTTKSTSSDDMIILVGTSSTIAVIFLVLLGLAICIGCILLLYKLRLRNKLKANELEPGVSHALNEPTSLEMENRSVLDDSLRSNDSEEYDFSSSLLPDTTSNQPDIPVTEFSQHVKKMHKESDEAFEEEYKSISDGKHSWSEGVKVGNGMIKNRFTNIFPFNYCRVKLAPTEDLNSDYINASWINGYKRDNAYIAAQGPLLVTIDDFWRMIWEYKLPTIVMVTKLVEVGRDKCQQYWPKALDESMEVGNDLCVTLKETKPFANYEMRILTVKNVAEPEMPPLKVLHCYYLGWPDHGVPQYPTSLLGFLKRVRKSHPYSGPPLLVHCSAGVGRTGTLIVLDIMLQSISQERSINVYECVKELRQRRCQMVQTMSQYMFIHDALDELITCGETEIAAINLLIAMKQLRSTFPGKLLSGYEEQYELLQQVSRKPSEKDYETIEQTGASSKNRYPNTIPYVPYSVDVAGSTKLDRYINASYIDGYMQKRGFVASQAPLANTVVDFWKMVWKTESITIVMLCNLTENGKEASSIYWPERVDECQEYGKVMVKLLSEEVDGDITKRRLCVTLNGPVTNKDSRLLTQFHFTDWNDTREQPSAASILQLNNFTLNLQKSTGNRSMVVMCSNGCGRTGTFLSIYSQIDRFKVEAVVDVFQCVKAARIQRMDLVGTVEQYVLIHEVLKEYMTSFDNDNYKNFL